MPRASEARTPIFVDANGNVFNRRPGVLGLPVGYRAKSDAEYRAPYRKRRGIPEHRAIVEQRTGIKLPEAAVVHHHDPNDKLTNVGVLVVCQDQKYHNLLERRTRALRACGHASWRKCRECGRWDDPANLRIWPDTTRPWQEKVSHHKWKGECVNKGERCEIRRPHRKPGLWRRPERFGHASEGER